MIKKIEGLRKFTDCSMPTDEKGRIEKAECAAYNTAIADVIKLLNLDSVIVPVCECRPEWMRDVRINLVKCSRCGEEY